MDGDEEGERLTEIGGAELPQPAAAAMARAEKSARLRQEGWAMRVHLAESKCQFVGSRNAFASIDAVHAWQVTAARQTGWDERRQNGIPGRTRYQGRRWRRGCRVKTIRPLSCIRPGGSLKTLLFQRKGLRPSRQPARQKSGGSRRHPVRSSPPLSIASALLLLTAIWGPLRAAAKGASFKPQ